MNKKYKWHKRHVTIDTPCHMRELGSIIYAIGEQCDYCDARVTVDDDKIVITFGDEPDNGECENKMQMING